MNDSGKTIIEAPTTLTTDGCRQRQQALLARLKPRGIRSVLIVGRRNVHYFSGHWARSILPSALLLRADGGALIALPGEATLETAEVVTYVGSLHATLIDDGQAAAIAAILEFVPSNERLGCDRPLVSQPVEIVSDDLLAMRRQKWPDEVALLGRAVRACEAAYAKAAEVIVPGLNELDLFAAVLSAATRSAGEPIGELGNDFRSGEGGGPPRDRAIFAGELLPLDLGVGVRGYTADLCRTFAVGRLPSQAQVDAHARVVEVLEEIQSMAGPGVSCRQLYDHASQRLKGVGDTTFGHHLGHGVGIAVHEAPRLNPNWNDTLETGDVFTVEPGLYGPSLNGGVRLEQMFHMTASGVERMSHFPLSLTP